MDRLRSIAACNLDRSRSDGRSGITNRHLATHGGIAGAGVLDTLRHLPLIEQRRAVCQCLGNGEDMRQNLVIDCDQAAGLIGDGLAGGSDRGDRMTGIERLVARHAVEADGADVEHILAALNQCAFEIGEVSASDHGLDPRQGQRLAGIDRADAGVGMGRTQDRAVEHTGRAEIRAVERAAGNLLGSVRADRTSADDAESGAFRGRVHAGILS